MKKITFAITIIMMGALAGPLVFGGFGHANAQSTPVIQITPQTLENGAVNAGYMQVLNTSSTETNGPFSWNVLSGSLPPGLMLQATSSGEAATISGTPTQVGAYTFTIDATNAVAAGSQLFSVDIEGIGGTTSTAPTAPTADTITIATSTATVSTIASTSSLAVELQDAEVELTDLQEELIQEYGINPGGPMIPAPAPTPAPTAGPVFSRDLTIGSTGADVLALQQFLNQNGYPVAASGPGSSGNETDYFGPLTQAALASWQAANGVSPAQGYYGPITRAKMNLTASSGS